MSSLSPLVGIEHNTRFMRAMLLICDVVETVEHYMNVRSAWDTITLLLVSTVAVLYFEYLIFAIPSLICIKILYNFATKTHFEVYEQDKSKSLRFIVVSISLIWRNWWDKCLLELSFTKNSCGIIYFGEISKRH